MQAARRIQAKDPDGGGISTRKEREDRMETHLRFMKEMNGESSSGREIKRGCGGGVTKTARFDEIRQSKRNKNGGRAWSSRGRAGATWMRWKRKTKSGCGSA